MRAWSWVAFPLLFVVTAFVAAVHPQDTYQAPVLLAVLNFTFITLASAFVAYVAARSFLARGAPSLLALGTGAVTLGATSLLAGSGGSSPNVNVTIYNLGMLLAGSCHLVAAASTLHVGSLVRRRGAALGAAYAGSLAAVAALALLARGGVLPTFFVQGQGGTAVRQLVLAGAVAAFGAAAGVLRYGGNERSDFRYRYAVGLALVAVGLYGVFTQASFGSAVSWLGRAAQFAGSVWMLVAVVASLRESQSGILSTDALLRQTEALYRSLFTLAPSGVALVDHQGRFVAFNDQAHRQLGYTREEFARLHVWDVDVDEVAERVRGQCFRFDPAREAEFEARHRTRSGELRDALVHVRPVEIAGARHVLAVVQDVTEQKRAAGRTERQHAVITGIARVFEVALTCETEEELGSACLAVAEAVTQSRFGFLDEVNPATDRLDTIAISAPGWEACSMQAGRGEGKREAPISLIIRGIPGRVVREGKSLVSNDPASHPDWIGVPPGHPPLHAFLGVPLLHGGRTWGVLALGNREGGYGPDELAAAEALAPAIVQAFMRKRAETRLREIDQRKTEFLAVLSHELRNPLAPIRNSIFLLDRADPSSEPFARAKEVIGRQTEHLTRLVDELLDVTRIARGKIALTRVRLDLREVVRKSADDFRAAMVAGGMALRVDVGAAPVWVDADAIRIAQVVGNLLHNAAKFTPPGETVTVTMAARDGRAELSVRDTGVGIEPGEVDRVFEPFAQADRTLARTQGGLGLGLALVKGIAELHGGSVTARSEGVGRGAEFMVALPLAAEPGASTGGGRTPTASHGRRVLIIEDNVDAGDTLADVLQLRGHHVRLARDGRSGVDSALEFRPDVVLCDVGLPDVDGYEVARTLKGKDQLGACRLVALTGYAQPEDRERAREAGFDAHMAKPPDLELLNELLTQPG